MFYDGFLAAPYMPYWVYSLTHIIYMIIIYVNVKQIIWVFLNVFLFSNEVNHKCNNSACNYSNTISIHSALWVLMALCFKHEGISTTMLNKHPCLSSCFGTTWMISLTCIWHIFTNPVYHINNWYNAHSYMDKVLFVLSRNNLVVGTKHSWYRIPRLLWA